MAVDLREAQQSMRTGRADRAVQQLESLTLAAPGDAHVWQLLGFAYREEQRMSEAARAFRRAAELDAHDAKSALGVAQSSFESGLPATELFRTALNLEPGNPAAIGGLANALAAEGQPAAAQETLVNVLNGHTDWLEGQRHLAALRWIDGDTQHFARGYEDACRLQPKNLALRLAWFGAVAQTRNWDAAAIILDEGEKTMGAAQAFTIARLFIASESGDRVRADELFAATSSIRDDVRDIAYIRHCLRKGDPGKAESVALRLVGTTSARIIWPYLSLIWRLLGDARAQWLDGAPPYIRAIDLDFAAGELDELAILLRKLHTARAPYLEQSVRGGTQTDQQLFFRHEPIIQNLKAKLRSAIRDYVTQLPEFVSGHPLLGTPRAQILFSGSWSVRLESQGFHVSHTHPRGWISSAFYVSLPSSEQWGTQSAGWINFGLPPRELAVDLPAYLQIEPKPGRLVLFPSTMWHSTTPFDDGERLTVAFDVAIKQHH